MVAGSTITGNTAYGINFAGQAGSLLSGEVVVDDVIQSNTVGGVLITDAPGTTVTSSTIGGATAGLGNIGFGVSVSGSANVSIKSSTVSHNTADGIDFNNSPNAILTGDTVQSNGGHGVLLTSSNGSLITSSTIGGTAAQGNGVGGVSLAGSSNVTIGGTLRRCWRLDLGQYRHRGQLQQHFSRRAGRGLDHLGQHGSGHRHHVL